MRHIVQQQCVLRFTFKNCQILRDLIFEQPLKTDAKLHLKAMVIESTF